MPCHRLEIESFPREQELVKTLTTKTYTTSDIFGCYALLKREMIQLSCFRNLLKAYQTALVLLSGLRTHHN